MPTGLKRVLATREITECQNCGDTDVLFVRDVCLVDECTTQIFSKRLCKAHYNRAYRKLQKARQEKRADGFWDQVEHYTNRSRV